MLFDSSAYSMSGICLTENKEKCVTVRNWIYVAKHDRFEGQWIQHSI